ncbi:DUF3630 family protein [Vibrio sp. SCSIO 43136]|uniref:DUF3630 family protein n=1 Tax=Vibrio sp. SCSIO 43136 TaxID=2819101 RepID=UPI0020766483|nr:DUF3630 family protein [Vibrio sp. SCSIO 43136]USD65345.1 DUF3630 family protein [Vibrio sp. SCSIO 43136]
MANFSLNHFDAEHGRIIIECPEFDYDSFAELGQIFVDLLSAKVIERQQDADLHTWLIDFEGCQLMLKGEHYSASMWLEALSTTESQEELKYLATLLKSGAVRR